MSENLGRPVNDPEAARDNTGLRIEEFANNWEQMA